MSKAGSQNRVVDPVLTSVAIGYTNGAYIGHFLFPRVPVGVRGGTIIEFGKEAFKRIAARRTPGAGTKRIQHGHQGKKFALSQDALEGLVPRENLEDAQQTPGINLGTGAVNSTLDIMLNLLEDEQAAIARNPANYTSTNKIDLTTSSWRNPDRNPLDDIAAGRTAVSNKIAKKPNTLALSESAFEAIRTNPNVSGKFSGIKASAITETDLASVIGIERVVVGSALIEPVGGGDPVPTWGNDAVLAYTDIGSVADRGRPSYGYTYTLNGNPFVEPTYYDENAKSWIYPVTYERSPELTGVDAGYLFIGAGAAFTG